MMRCGLLGRKLGHSYSPKIHAFLGDYSYSLFEVEPENLACFLKNGNYNGINVTMPYKKDVIPYLDELSPIARQLGAVNTIVRSSDGKLVGHNTDYFGFQSMVAASGLAVSGKKVLVLGSGGASRPVCAVLQDLGAQVMVISRTGENNYRNLDRHRDAAVIVNATPVGMYPNTGVSPIDLNLFPHLEGVLDIIYNPARTRLMIDAEEKGLVTMNGLLMLVAQAKEASEWFTGRKIDNEVVLTIYRRLRRQAENIVLIGMPGCGKSTIGKKLAERLQLHFVDADAEIEALAQKSIPQIFSEDGEDVFRTHETVVLERFGKESGSVIATGGGCVTKGCNYPLLHQNGTIIWLTRDLEQLPTDGRPLSQANSLESMYEIRKPLYERFADLIIANDHSIDAVVDRIIEALEEKQ